MKSATNTPNTALAEEPITRLPEKNLRGRYGSAGNKDDRFDAYVLGDEIAARAAGTAQRATTASPLALRGVPQAAISQLMGHADPRITAIYTTVAASALIGVLDDAGLL